MYGDEWNCLEKNEYIVRRKRVKDRILGNIYIVGWLEEIKKWLES